MHITVKDLKILQTQEPVFIVDVRETWELLEQSIDGALIFAWGTLRSNMKNYHKTRSLYPMQKRP